MTAILTIFGGGKINCIFCPVSGVCTVCYGVPRTPPLPSTTQTRGIVECTDIHIKLKTRDFTQWISHSQMHTNVCACEFFYAFFEILLPFWFGIGRRVVSETDTLCPSNTTHCYNALCCSQQSNSVVNKVCGVRACRLEWGRLKVYKCHTQVSVLWRCWVFSQYSSFWS